MTSLLFLLACTEPLWYPQPPEDILGDWTNYDTAGELDTADTEPELPCSSSSGQAVDYTMTNTAAIPVRVYWRDSTCTETPYFDLNPGDAITSGTFTGHVWVARDGEVYVDHVTVRNGETWEISQ